MFISFKYLMLKYKLIFCDQIINNKILNKSEKNFVIKLSGPLGNNEIILKNNLFFFKNNSLVHFFSQATAVGSISQISTLSNMFKGLICGYKQFLEIRGVGYKLTKNKTQIQLDVGFSGPIYFLIQDGLSIKIKKNRILKIFGTQLLEVKQTAARLRLLKKPEPYKGKGLRYLNEVVLQKEGKKKKK